jgi:molecular chaperone Hsp33
LGKDYYEPDVIKCTTFNWKNMIEHDLLRRFLFEELGVRGEWVKLTTSWQAAKLHQRGSEIVQQQLGQALAAVVMLSATVKFKGSMILQAQGDGNIKTLVAQATDQQKIRGLIRSKENVPEGSLEAMFGQGRLVLTIESENGPPYQGIVPLQGSNLAAALETYFEQSEQLKTRLWLFANATHAVGLLLQELPAQENYEADWEHIQILATTITEQELFELDCEPLLYRLFNQEKVRVFDPEPVEFSCACSRSSIEKTLFAMGRTELEDILKEQGIIEVNCEFCNERYRFDKVDVESILSQQSTTTNTETRH